MKFRLFRRILIGGCVIVAFSGCVYRMDIPQGNRIDASLVQQLEIGMSRNQVKFLLGTPAIVDLYQPDQWHYIYYLKTGDDGEIEKKRMTLTFSNDLLSKIEGNLNPG
ncbi:MAG: outer membrane protein assembly factor BamE [Gammaproteobacteria bacterium]|nr:outer membrane protein assembly factor BamE [Gammaproteobacteria bacterium]